MNSKSLVLYTVLIAAAIGSGYLARDDGAPAATASTATQTAYRGFYLQDARILGTGTDGALLYELTADRAEQTSENSVRFENVRFHYSPASNLPWTVDADEAVMHDEQRRVMLSGHVRIRSSRSEALPATEIRAPYIELDPGRFTAETDARVQIRIGERSLTGTGMLASLADERLELQSRVSGLFFP